MRSLALLLFFVATSGLGQECEPEIPEIGVDCTGTEDTIIRYEDPANCTAYYYCEDGCGGHDNCPEDQALNTANGLIVCDSVCNVSIHSGRSNSMSSQFQSIFITTISQIRLH